MKKLLILFALSSAVLADEPTNICYQAGDAQYSLIIGKAMRVKPKQTMKSVIGYMAKPVAPGLYPLIRGVLGTWQKIWPWERVYLSLQPIVGAPTIWEFNNGVEITGEVKRIACSEIDPESWRPPQ